MSKLEEKLKKLSEGKGAKVEGINLLIDYYQKSLGWSKTKAINYVIKLFEDGTIDSIMVIKKGGNNNA